MKQIVAVVKPFLAEKVLEGLKRAPLEALSVREVKGYGRQKSYLNEYSDTEYALAFLPKVEISLWVDDARVDEIVRKIIEVARTGRMGDGKIFVLPVDQQADTIDIASGERSSGERPSGDRSSPERGSGDRKSDERRTDDRRGDDRHGDDRRGTERRSTDRKSGGGVARGEGPAKR